MLRKMRYSGAFIFPFVMLMSLFACHRPAHLNVSDESGLSVFTKQIALKDTLPEHIVESLHLQDVMGLEFTYPDGHVVRYFDYETDKNALLAAISNLPFSKYAQRADTACRSIPFEDIDVVLRSQVNSSEIDGWPVFWDSSGNDFDVYECQKAPARHILLISRDTNRVLHRIEFSS